MINLINRVELSKRLEKNSKNLFKILNIALDDSNSIRYL